MKQTISVLGGEFVHQTTTQFNWLAGQAPEKYAFDIADDASLFERLGRTDLLVIAGLHWSGSETVTWCEPAPYQSPTESQRAGLRAYVGSGRPVLNFHGGIASFDDWPEFSRLTRFGWHWGITGHGPRQNYRVYPTAEAADLLPGQEEFTILDENYYNVQVVPEAAYRTHLKMDCGATQQPMLVTTESVGGKGSGRSAYLALGHDMEAIAHPAFQPIFWKTVGWLLSEG